MDPAILSSVSSTNILTEEFAQAAATAGLRVWRNALASGRPVVFVDEFGRYVEELPDGTRCEICPRPGTRRESYVQILSEIATAVG